MKIVIIGAGNVATHLGCALKDVGHSILQVYSRTLQSAQGLGERLCVPYTNQVSAITSQADFYIVSIKDFALQEFIPELVKGREQALFVHTAGSMPMDVWKGHATHYGVLYPMQTFSKQRKVDFSSIPFFLEASDENHLQMLKQLAADLGSQSYCVNSEQRKKIHLAAVFACNFSNHMYALSAQILEKEGLPFSVMESLVAETASKVHELSPVEAQTGPAVRYDTNVMDKQLSLLADEPEMQEIYQKVSDSIHRLATKQDKMKL